MKDKIIIIDEAMVLKHSNKMKLIQELELIEYLLYLEGHAGLTNTERFEELFKRKLEIKEKLGEKDE